MAATDVHVRVLSFGPWRDRLPDGGFSLGVPAGSVVGDLLRRLEQRGSFDARQLGAAAVAVNQEYAGRGQVLVEGDEVAILPPVSGGVDAGPRVAIVQKPIRTDEILGAIKAGADGAVCVFDGIVRNNTKGRQTLHLDYEAYEVMALQQMQALRTEAIGRFDVRDVAIVHRLGRLSVGETSVLIAVASAHRGAAFEACRWVIDTLKKSVPIWKKEQFADGAVWADGESFPEDIAG